MGLSQGIEKEVKMSKQVNKKNEKSSVRKNLRNLRRVNSIIKQVSRIHKSGSFEKETDEIEALAKRILDVLKRATSTEEVLKYYGLK